jgi:hypothetical protein
MPLVTPRPCC